MTQSPDGLTATNGPASLSDRVKGLRLNDRLDAPKGGGSAWLPWTLCLLMALTWASFGVRAYTSGGWKAIFGSKTDDPSGTRAAPADASKKDKAAVGSADEIILTDNGNNNSAQQIQVAPD